MSSSYRKGAYIYRVITGRERSYRRLLPSTYTRIHIYIRARIQIYGPTHYYNTRTTSRSLRAGVACRMFCQYLQKLASYRSSYKVRYLVHTRASYLRTLVGAAVYQLVGPYYQYNSTIVPSKHSRHVSSKADQFEASINFQLFCLSH